jgi:hypothetical protein
LGVIEVFDHKAVSILSSVKKLLQEYDLDFEKAGVINTDNASANKKAFR